MKEGKVKKIDELVEEVLKQMGVYRQYKEQEIREIWPDVVGRMIASHTRKIEVVDRKLVVSFTSAVVKNEMMMVKEGLVQALNERIGEVFVDDIVIR